MDLENHLYVAPLELALGLRNDVCKGQRLNVAVARLFQSKFHFIPISKTVMSLFQRDDFRKAYKDFNCTIGHRTVEGVYTDYSSGNRFRSNELFSQYPNSLQIELSTDDFDVCNGIGSKASMHKLCPPPIVFCTVDAFTPNISIKKSTSV